MVCLITGLSEGNSGYHNSVLSYRLTSPSATLQVAVLWSVKMEQEKNVITRSYDLRLRHRTQEKEIWSPSRNAAFKSIRTYHALWEFGLEQLRPIPGSRVLLQKRTSLNNKIHCSFRNATINDNVWQNRPLIRIRSRFVPIYTPNSYLRKTNVNPLNPELNPICYLLALLGAHHFLHVSRIRVKLLTFRLLMSYTYRAPILDVSRSHTTMQHSR